MILCDVNIFVQALFADAPNHAQARRAIDHVLASPERFACADFILAAVVRISTNKRIFAQPASARDAFAFAEVFRVHPKAVNVGPGRRHWRIFRDLVDEAAIVGPDTTDAYIAALAVEHACDLWSLDRGFRRFGGLRSRNLIDQPV